MRIAGAVIVAVSSALIGYCLSRRLSAALSKCEQLLRIMKYVRDEIAVNRTPTDVITARLRSSFGVAADGANGLYDALMNGAGVLTAEEKETLSLFCSQIGKGGAEVQRSQFDSLIACFEERTAKRREDLKKDSRLYVSLSLFAGVLIIIILI